MNRNSGLAIRRRMITGVLLLLTFCKAAPLIAESTRVTSGLQALYTFDAGSGTVVRDRSGVKPPLDLMIDSASAIKWQNGSLVVRSSTMIRSATPARKLFDAVKRSGAISIEAWITPQSDSQTGPARIVTLSADPNKRNFTLGQDGNRYDARLRTTSTSVNGIPATAAPKNSVRRKLTHVVFTHHTGGRSEIFVNGRRRTTKTIPGQPNNWNQQFRLTLANEATGDRPWLGTFHLVAAYRRALTSAEIARNFKAGPNAGATPTDLAANSLSPSARLFETRVASIFARRCLECHEPSTKKGGLDLSQKKTAMAGGDNGTAIVAGKSEASLLWKRVEADEMPAQGQPLSADERKLLRKWIDAGADWSIETIDPAVFAYDNRAGGIWIQRLTVPEYIETVRQTVGVDISKEAGQVLPRDVRADGFSNTAYNLTIDLKHVESYAKLAEIIVGRMDVASFAKRFSRSRRLIDDDNRALISAMGKWLLRGPLRDREIVSYRGISTSAASAGGDFDEATGYVIEAMLQSPRFIYRVENQRGDGTAWPVGEFELASRLSYIIWGGPPDKELMRAADAGELHDSSRFEAQVQRMLAHERAVAQSTKFVVEWLNLNRLKTLKPNRQRFPNWSDELVADMRAETSAFFHDVVWKQKRPLAELFNAQVTFATPRLAEHYGLKPMGEGLQRYDLTTVAARGGLLTQGSVLTIGGDDASMVTRGLFVLQDVLRGTVKDPPPGLDTTPVPTKPGLSHRRIAEMRVSSVACGACHVKFEPLAYGLERFDGVGAYHERDEHGNQLREDGNLLIPGTAKSVKYQSTAELMNRLAGSQRVSETMTWKLTQFALGRPLVAADARAVNKIHASAQKGGGTYTSLMRAIALSELVQTTRTETDSPETNR